MGAVKANTKEYLSHDILDEEFVRTFAWVYRLQKLLGSCRVDAKDRFVTAPTNYQKLYTVFCILCILNLNYTFIVDFIGTYDFFMINALSVAIVNLYFITYACHVVHARFSNNKQNTEFHVKMQKNDRNMKIEKTKAIYDSLRFVNNACLAFVIVLHVFFFIILMLNKWQYVAFVGSVVSHLTFIIELIHCSGLVSHFVTRLKFVNGILKNYLFESKTVEKGNISKSKNHIADLSAVTHKFETSETSQYLREVFECFAMFQNLYRFQLLLFTVNIVIISLIGFELLLYSIQKNIIYWNLFATLALFAVMDISTALVLGVRMEVFFGEVTDIKRTSIAIMAKHQDGNLRYKARAMLKIIEETPPVFSIYHMWEMNARILITMFSLVTSLIVTLLQFAFL